MRIEELTWKVQSFHRDFTSKFPTTKQKQQQSKERYSSIGQGIFDVNPVILIKTFLQRVMDDDRLSDSCWNSEMREVELWENERFGGIFVSHSLVCTILISFLSTGLDPIPLSVSSTTSIPASVSASTFSFPISTSSSSLLATPQKGWSKQNLKIGERNAWTRGRDGWSPVVSSNPSNVGASTGSGTAEGHGEIRFVPCLKRMEKKQQNLIEMQQQSHILVSSWVGVCGDGGLEEGFSM
jgi:hypothetical protein